MAQQQEDRLENRIYAENDEEESEESSVESEERQYKIAPQLTSNDVSDLLQSLGVSNSWGDSVPTRFLSIVFAAAQGSLFTIPQAKALCDLYQAR